MTRLNILRRGVLWLPVVLLLVTALSMTAISTRAAPARALVLTFGVYTSDKPTVMYRMFKPALAELEGEVSREMGRPVKIKMRIYKSYEDATQALIEGKVDFVRFGPASYIIAKEANPDIALLGIELRSEDSAKARTFYGVILARKDRGIETLRDLKGHTFAFGDQNSTIGRYLSQASLVDAGLTCTDLDFEFLERHDRVVTAVLHGKFAAGAAKESTFRKYAGDELRIVGEPFVNVTKPWVARAGLEPELTKSLRKGLHAVKSPAALKAIHKKLVGFGAVDDSEYEFVRTGMTRAKAFDKPCQDTTVSIGEAE